MAYSIMKMARKNFRRTIERPVINQELNVLSRRNVTYIYNNFYLWGRYLEISPEEFANLDLTVKYRRLSRRNPF